MGNTFLYRMPAGIAGAISRPQDLTVEPQLLDSSNLFPAYGLGGKISSGKFVPIAASDTASVLVGIYVRPYPTASQPDKVQQVGTRFRNLFPYRICKRSIPAGERRSPEERFDDVCGMRGHSIDRNLNDNDCQS